MSNSSDPRAAPGYAPAVTDDADTALDAHGHDPAAYDWVPVLRKPRADGWSPQRQRAFIGELADCGSVAAAAQQVGMSASSAYKLRRSREGAAFAAAWDAAIRQAAHALVDAAFERAINGSEEPVYGRDGQVVGRRFRQSDGLMMFLLRKHFPERYGDFGRDRPETQSAPPVIAVAETMIALGPVQPAAPAALMSPEDAAMRFDIADQLDGELPRWSRQDGGGQRDLGVLEPDAAFEEALAAAKRAANPKGYAAADARTAARERDEAEARERGARRRRPPPAIP
ncbi:hypothetical protein [uncultured Sphingomonas sp.]|uniref:hypothetical protein n=1 Tax=uncultured Sphingomonas sp. TaxID=158754 RepID=UPI0035CB4455